MRFQSISRNSHWRAAQKKPTPAPVLKYGKTGKTCDPNDPLFKGKKLTGEALIHAQKSGRCEFEVPDNVRYARFSAHHLSRIFEYSAQWDDRSPRMHMPPMHAALFDIDKTLFDGEAGSEFLHWLLAAGVLNYRTCARKLGFDFFRLRNFCKYNAAGAQILSGFSVNFVRKLAQDFLSRYVLCDEIQNVHPFFYAKGIELIEKHKKRGDIIVFASGSNYYLVEAFARHLGADYAIGTQTKVKNGLLMKEIWGPIIGYTGKRDVVRELLAQLQIPLENAWVYSDDIEMDDPFLKGFGQPNTRIVTNFDWDLIRAVEKTGFSILRTDQQTTPMSPIQIGAIGKYRHYVRQEKGKNYDPSSSSPQTTWPIL